MNNPFVVFKHRTKADVLILIGKIEAKILKTDPTHAPKVTDISTMNRAIVSLLL